MMVHFRPIPFDQTFPLRRRILRDNDPNAKVEFEGGWHPKACHMGAFDATGTLIGIGSVMPQPMAARPNKRGWRLRNMAVDAAWRRNGVGRAILLKCIEHVQQQDGELLWFNARSTALPFYDALDFQIEGAEFMSDNHPHYLMWKLLDAG